MEELLKVIEVWKSVEETMNLSSQKGSYMDGYRKGFIKAMNDVRELLASQQPNAADGNEASEDSEIEAGVNFIMDTDFGGD